MRRVLGIGMAGLALGVTALVLQIGTGAPGAAPAGAAQTPEHHETLPDLRGASGTDHTPLVAPSSGSLIPIAMDDNGATALPTAYDSSTNSFSIDYGQPVDPSEASSNWSGYAEQGSFTAASATWTVPSVASSSTDEYSSTWVGIDGYSASDSFVIQTGTDQDSGPNGGYDAWWELYPQPSVTLSTGRYPVEPGDVMTGSVQQVAGTTWSIELADATRHWSFSTEQSYTGPGTSAEWIEEAPCCTTHNGILPLAAFSQANFSALSVNTSTPAPSPSPSSPSPSSPSPSPSSPTPSSSPSPTTSSASGYDLVGSDGGVFVFSGAGASGFYGSLPALGVKVDDVVGMVPSPDERGYFLVGADGGVFSFGDAPYLGSLPGLGLSVGDIRGIVPTSDDRGYFLVGADGGVFGFGDAPYLGSLPARGISRDDIVGIAATPSDEGYWVVAANGTVYAFGNAQNLGSAPASFSPVAGISATASGNGYWIVTTNGSVYAFGDAGYYGSLPNLGVTVSRPVTSLVPTADREGYWLVGSDGGIFAFGDAPFVGSLPAMGVRVTNIVGAVPTS